MCRPCCISFGKKNLIVEDVKGKKIIEVGSLDINGSLRPYIMTLGPLSYIGIDIEKGNGVDIICNAEHMVERFGKEIFDVVISTETLEHVEDWTKVISNIKNICKPNGIILITTCSYGYGYHACPYDFWRFEPDDMVNIFSDCKVLSLEKDSKIYAVSIKVRKPDNFIEKDLSDYKLYNIMCNDKIKIA